MCIKNAATQLISKLPLDRLTSSFKLNFNKMKV